MLRTSRTCSSMVLRRPVAGIHRRQHVDLDRGRAEHEVTLGRHVAGVVDHHRHHGHAGLHGQVEGAFLERAEVG
jgi:hypothetical protein